MPQAHVARNLEHSLELRAGALLAKDNNVIRADEQLRPAGLEPATDGLEIRCSIQLSYGRGWWVWPVF
jgi:hypothetical protein